MTQEYIALKGAAKCSGLFLYLNKRKSTIDESKEGERWPSDELWREVTAEKDEKDLHF